MAEPTPTPTTESPATPAATPASTPTPDAPTTPVSTSPEVPKDETMEDFLAEDFDKEPMDLDEPESGGEPTKEPAGEPEVKPTVEVKPGEVPPVVEVPPVKGQEPAPVTEPTPTPAPVVATPPVTPTPGEPVAPAPAAEPTPTEAPATVEQLRANYDQYRKDAEDVLATQHYALTEEQTAELATDPEALGKLIPRLAARVYMDAVTGTLGQVLQHLPQAVEQALQTRNVASSSEEKFFEMWPQLKDPTHRDTIGQLGVAYRQVHPLATPEEFTKNVGAQAMLALQLMPGAPVAPPTTNGSGVPVVAAAPTVTPTPAPAFAPAGGSPPSTGKLPKTNPYSDLAEEFAIEDAEDIL